MQYSNIAHLWDRLIQRFVYAVHIINFYLINVDSTFEVYPLSCIMNPLIKTSTKCTPFINIDYDEASIKIIGKSINANPSEFYEGLSQKLNKIQNTNKDAITITFKIDVLDINSGHYLLDFVRKVKALCQGKKLKVNWFYDKNNEVMREIGEDYESILDINFNYFTMS